MLKLLLWYIMLHQKHRLYQYKKLTYADTNKLTIILLYKGTAR